jgi:hypothetical protein
LPSSLTRDHSSALVSSTCLPVSVCGTGTAGLPSRHFSTAQVPRHRSSEDDLRIASRSPTVAFGSPVSLPACTALISPRRLPLSVRRRSSDPTCGTGMCTRCPSPSPFGYGLGPTNPPRITRAAEPLGFRRWGFLPHFSVTHSGIRTRGQSTGAYAPASTRPRRSPTIPPEGDILRFGAMLCPGTASARRYSTSELLRTLSRVAASKPTSWLSARHHSLFHSASTWGP